MNVELSDTFGLCERDDESPDLSCSLIGIFPPMNCIWLIVFTINVELVPEARFTPRAPASFIPMSRRLLNMHRRGAPPTTENKFATGVLNKVRFEAILETQQKIVLIEKKTDVSEKAYIR